MTLLNKQRVFNKVWDYFVVQKKPQSRGIGIFGACKYRSADGNKCAIGCLIPDELYSPEFDSPGEGLSSAVDDLVTTIPEFRLALGSVVDLAEENMMRLLLSLQCAHDEYFDEIEDALRNVASTYNLEVPSA